MHTRITLTRITFTATLALTLTHNSHWHADAAPGPEQSVRAHGPVELPLLPSAFRPNKPYLQIALITNCTTTTTLITHVHHQKLPNYPHLRPQSL
jgi:hypothetical protein